MGPDSERPYMSFQRIWILKVALKGFLFCFFFLTVFSCAFMKGFEKKDT